MAQLDSSILFIKALAGSQDIFFGAETKNIIRGEATVTVQGIYTLLIPYRKPCGEMTNMHAALAELAEDTALPPVVDQTILYENATMSATQFPLGTNIDIDISGNTLVAINNNAIAASTTVSQDIVDADFKGATTTIDNLAVNYNIDSATTTVMVLSGLALTDGDILLLNEGVSTVMVAFNTAGLVTATGSLTYSIDISSANLTNAPVSVTKYGPGLQLSVVGSGMSHAFVTRNPQTYNGDAIGGFINAFEGYPCEFDYFNAYHKHNITHDTIPNPIGNFLPSGTLANPKSEAQTVVTKSRVYIIGGQLSLTIISAPINSDGTLGAFIPDGALPSIMNNAQSLVTRDRVYIIGGATTTIVSAPINPDGTLGLFTADGALLNGMDHANAAVTKSRFYMIGGTTATILSAPITPDGTLGTFVPEPPLNERVIFAQTVVTKSRVYLLGGYNLSGITDEILSATIASDGTVGTFSSAGGLPFAVYGAQSVVTKSHVYLFGGIILSGGVSTTILSAPINPDGTLGAFITYGTLPNSMYGAQTVVTKSRIYIIGGYDAAVTGGIMSAPFIGWEITSNGYASARHAITKITTVFDTDNRRGRDIAHRVELHDIGDEVTRISTVVGKIT